jgi:hypothetical protein
MASRPRVGPVAEGQPMTEPDDAALLEYGRLIWAAIRLEDAVYHMGGSLGMDVMELKAGSITAAVSEMRRDLRRNPESEAARKARRWFRVALRALSERNKVLHVVPGVWVTVTADHAVTQHEPVLEYLGRKPGSYLRTPMTAEGLHPIRQRIEQAHSGWIDVFVALAAEYEHLNPNGT